MNEKLTRWVFYFCAISVVVTLVFFILYKAEWLIGDDAIIIKQTAWGHRIDPANTVWPSSGRFFPLAYIVFNVIWLFGLTSVNAHFILVALFFISSSILIMILGSKSIFGENFILRYITVFAYLMICIQRIYSNYLDLYSTFWFDYFLVILFGVCCCYVHSKQSFVYSLLGFCSVTILCYCIEVGFIIPIIYGSAGLLFSWRKISKIEKMYLWSLVGTALVFLIIYFVKIFPYIETAYSGDHGENLSFVENALKQLMAQKVLLLGLIIFCVRFYRICYRKEEYEFWDSIILAGFGYCLGCAVLKLNWVLYYSLASIFILPAIANYLVKYIGNKWAAIVLVCLAVFMCRKMPQVVKDNQQARINTSTLMNIISQEYSDGKTFYYYEPSDNRPWCFDLEFRQFIKSSLQTQIGWQVKNEDFKFVSAESFSGLHGIYILPIENDKLFPGKNDSIASRGHIIWSINEDTRLITVVDIE